MPRSRRLALAVGALTLGAFVLTLTGGPRALAKGKKEETLRYATSWVQAVTEARARNAVLFATFHKDNWGGCKAQHRSVLENKKFIEWANENVVVVVGHTETEHPTETEDEKGNKTPGCPLYPGLTCEQHRAIPGECRNPPEGFPKLESTNGMPNSWLMKPDGTVSSVEAADQQVAGKIEELATALQKEVGKSLGYKKYEKYLEDLQATDEALGKGELKDALKTLAKVEKDAAKLPEGMQTEVDKRVEALEKASEDALAAIADGSDDAAAKVKAANKLKTLVGMRLKRGYLPVVDKIKEWLQQAKDGATGAAAKPQ